MEFSTSILWLIALVALGILEAATTQLVSLWFIVGAAAAFVASLLGATVWVQIALFVVVSVLILVTLRPVLMRKLAPKKTPTNADMAIGKVAVVIDKIDGVSGAGRVALSGLDWAAVSKTGEDIKVGTEVKVEAIDGVKLIVKPIKEKV